MEQYLNHFLKGKEAKMKEVRYGKIAHYVRKSVWNSWVKTWLKGENCSFFQQTSGQRLLGHCPLTEKAAQSYVLTFTSSTRPVVGPSFFCGGISLHLNSWNFLNLATLTLALVAIEPL